MPMNRQQKEDMVKELSDKIASAKGGLIASFVGLNVASVDKIRAAFKAAEIEYKVVKNTLMRRALSGTSIESLKEAFIGPTAIALIYNEDEVGQLGRVAKDIRKEFEAFEVKAGYIENDILEGDIVETLASLPTLDEARAQILGVLNAPASKLLAQINAPAQNLVGVIQAKQQKDEAA